MWNLHWKQICVNIGTEILPCVADNTTSFLGKNFTHNGSHPWKFQRLSAIWIHYVKGKEYIDIYIYICSVITSRRSYKDVEITCWYFFHIFSDTFIPVLPFPINTGFLFNVLLTSSAADLFSYLPDVKRFLRMFSYLLWSKTMPVYFM